MPPVKTPPAVVLLSGGLDSCVAAAEAAARGPVALLHLNYRQRTELRELRAFEAIADHYAAAARLVVDVSYMKQIGGSSLLSSAEPLPSDEGPGVPSTYVPFRNANLLGVGVAWAEVLGSGAVYIGVHQEEAAYPDCRAEFVEAYNRMVREGTRPTSRIEVRAPLIGLDKAAIVRSGADLGAPLHLSWSCYQAQERACGVCHSCRLRLRGFRRAGIEDPVPYADSPEEETC